MAKRRALLDLIGRNLIQAISQALERDADAVQHEDLLAGPACFVRSMNDELGLPN
jgi:hypothetical protein